MKGYYYVLFFLLQRIDMAVNEYDQKKPLLSKNEKITDSLYSQTSIYVLLYIRTFDLRTIFFKRITLYMYLNLIYILCFTYSNLIYVLCFRYSNSIYVLQVR